MKKKIIILVGLLLISVNLYAAGDLTVQGIINAKDIVVENTSDGIIIKNDDAEAVTFENLDGAIQLKMTNATDSSPVVFEMKSDQVPTTGHFDVIPGGMFDYWLFADSGSGRNRAFKVCGYPSAASSTQCVSFRIEGANNDLNMSTDGAGSNILLTPQANVGIGTPSPGEKLEVAGNIYASGVVTWGSSRELKKDISALSTEEAVSALENLSPKKYYYKADSRDEHIGFIAEEVPELVATRDRKSLDPMDIVGVLTKVVKEQQKSMQIQQELAAKQQKEITVLLEKVNALEREMKLEKSLALVAK